MEWQPFAHTSATAFSRAQTCGAGAGLTFLRTFQPYQNEDPRGATHQYFPFKDGPRGVGWISSYSQGLVRPHSLIFVPPCNPRALCDLASSLEVHLNHASGPCCHSIEQRWHTFASLGGYSLDTSECASLLCYGC